jgi:hypothetical protein
MQDEAARWQMGDRQGRNQRRVTYRTFELIWILFTRKGGAEDAYAYRYWNRLFQSCTDRFASPLRSR